MEFKNKTFLKRKSSAPPDGAVIRVKEVAQGRAESPTGEVRIPLELKEWAATYAAKHHTTVNQIVIDHLVNLRKRDQGIDVDQV